MKTVKIPSDYNPYIVVVNGVTYAYKAGTTQDVPDEVAAVIENYNKLSPKGKPTDGGVLPFVTREDDGKLLGVDDGAWGKVNPPEGGGMENPMTAAGDIIYGGEDGTPTKLAAGVSAQMLVIDPETGLPKWVNQPSPGMSNPMTAMGDLIVGGIDGVAGRVSKGTAGQFLRMNALGTLPEWATVPSANGNSF